METVCTTQQHLTSTLLDTYLGKNITAICPHGYDASDLNHCAHFVCHVMSLATGSISCRGMSVARDAEKIGVCIRVHELFLACGAVGLYKDITEAQANAGVFVFVCKKNNPVRFHPRSFHNVPRKHVGIGLAGTVWHYSNGRDEVVTTTIAEFRKHYSQQENELYFGTFPDLSFPSSLNCGR